MADFSHYVCWDRERVYKVLNLEAERSDRDVFLAVHSDRPLKVITAAAGGPLGAHGVDTPAQDFIQRFLQPQECHVQAVVVGDSGTGKSHFIKWLSMRIEETPERIVLTIPKSGTSLRGIVEMILDRLPEHEAEKHRAALDVNAFDADTPENKRRRLVMNIALELGNATPTPGDRLERALLDDRLRLLFTDVHLLETQLARSGGIIERLVDHVGERRGAGASDLPHEFTAVDLPRTGADAKDVATETRKVLNLLAGDDEMEAAAVRLVNRVLGQALARTLAFSPDRLLEVMLQLRRHLAAGGKELVLLIEDFARLQGIDGGLLAALIEAGGGETGLCVMRWCMAITQGPYEAVVRDTLKTRLDLVVDMTQTAAEYGADVESLAGFAAQYLNATRVGADLLAAWASDPTAGRPPNGCDDCEFRQGCHETFGHCEEIGLYPFTRQALPHMLDLVAGGTDHKFNPRQFIKGVLKPTLADHDLEWRELRTFPSIAYLNALGGPDPGKIDNLREQEITEQYGDEAPRWVAFLDLWGNADLTYDERQARAFGLTPVAGPGPKGPGKPPAPQPVTETPDQRLIDALNDWGRGGPLEDWATTRLRTFVWDAIDSGVDWDIVGIAPGYIMRSDAKSVFKAASIRFQNQTLARLPGEIVLDIPGSNDPTALRQASIALQALVTMRAGLPFRPDHGPLGLSQFGAHLEAWSAAVLRQAQDYVLARGPLDDACEVLLYRTALEGRLPDAPADWINEAFKDPELFVAPSPAWRTLYDDLSEDRTQATAYVRSLSSMTKGGRIGASIDPRPLLEAIKRINGAASQSPRTPRSDASPIARGIDNVRSSLPSLVRVEAVRELAWHSSYRLHLGELAGYAEFQALILDLRQEAIRCGIPFSRLAGTAALDGLDKLAPILVDREAIAVTALGIDPDAISLEQLAAPVRWLLIRDWELAMPAVKILLDEIEASVSSASNVEELAAAIESRQARIDPLLTQLIASAGDIEAQQ